MLWTLEVEFCESELRPACLGLALVGMTPLVVIVEALCGESLGQTVFPLAGNG